MPRAAFPTVDNNVTNVSAGDHESLPELVIGVLGGLSSWGVHPLALRPPQERNGVGTAHPSCYSGPHVEWGGGWHRSHQTPPSASTRHLPSGSAAVSPDARIRQADVHRGRLVRTVCAWHPVTITNGPPFPSQKVPIRTMSSMVTLPPSQCHMTVSKIIQKTSTQWHFGSGIFLLREDRCFYENIKRMLESLECTILSVQRLNEEKVLCHLSDKEGLDKVCEVSNQRPPKLRARRHSPDRGSVL